MTPVIPMIGVYEESQAVTMRRWLYDYWTPLARTAIVYIRVYGDGDTESERQASRAQYLRHVIDIFESHRPDEMRIIYGMEVCAGSLTTSINGYFHPDRWARLAELSRVIQKASRQRPVVWVHESETAMSVAGDFHKALLGYVERCYDMIRGLEIWSDYPVARHKLWWAWWTANRQKPWYKLINYPPGWKSIAPVPGFYDPELADEGSMQYRELQAHKSLGADHMPRVFVSSNGLYGGDGVQCFHAGEGPNPSTSLRLYLTKLERESLLPVILYPGHREFVNVAKAMNDWYVR